MYVLCHCWVLTFHQLLWRWWWWWYCLVYYTTTSLLSSQSNQQKYVDMNHIWTKLESTQLESQYIDPDSVHHWRSSIVIQCLFICPLTLKFDIQSPFKVTSDDETICCSCVWWERCQHSLITNGVTAKRIKPQYKVADSAFDAGQWMKGKYDRPGFPLTDIPSCLSLLQYRLFLH